MWVEEYEGDKQSLYFFSLSTDIDIPGDAARGSFEKDERATE